MRAARGDTAGRLSLHGAGREAKASAERRRDRRAAKADRAMLWRWTGATRGSPRRDAQLALDAGRGATKCSLRAASKRAEADARARRRPRHDCAAAAGRLRVRRVAEKRRPAFGRGDRGCNRGQIKSGESRGARTERDSAVCSLERDAAVAAARDDAAAQGACGARELSGRRPSTRAGRRIEGEALRHARCNQLHGGARGGVDLRSTTAGAIRAEGLESSYPPQRGPAECVVPCASTASSRRPAMRADALKRARGMTMRVV